MKTGPLSIVTGVLLVLCALFNFGAGIGQYTKAELVAGSSSSLASFSDSLGDVVSSKGMQGLGAKNKADAREMRSMGRDASTTMFVIAVFILVSALVQIVAGIGVFTSKDWALKISVAAVVCGVIVEIQDVTEDGFGFGQILFFAIYAFILYALFAGQQTQRT